MAADDTRTGTAAFLAAAAANRQQSMRGNGSIAPLDTTAAAEIYGGSDALFAPGTPIQPDAQRPLRYVDYAANINTQRDPRAYEGFSFAALRSFANIEAVRLAIETRKEQVESLEWAVQLRNPVKGEKDDNDPQIKAAQAFLNRPDGTNEFSTWVRMLLEEALVLDAPAVEMQRTVSGKLAAMLIVPGDTIVPRVDVQGRRPTGPDAVAYQQKIKGVVWANLTDEELLYLPRNPRPGKIYGYGPVEQIIVTIQTILARQAGQLGYFTDGNIPAGILTGPEGWKPAQLKEMQDAFEVLLKGDPNHKSKLIWTPFGTKYQSFKEAPLKDEFDEWLYRVVMYCFNLPPTAFIKATSRGAANNDTERGAQEGIMPIKMWLKRFFDRVLADYMGSADYEFVWTDKTEVAPADQAKVDDIYLKNGSTTINEVRIRRGLTPVPDGDVLLIYSPSGVLPLKDLLAAPVQQGNNDGGQQPGAGGKTPVTAGNPAKPPVGGVGAKQPAKAVDPARKLAKAAAAGALPVISASRPKARRHAYEIADAAHKVLQRAAPAMAAQAERTLRGMHKAITLDGVNTDPYDILNEGDDDNGKARDTGQQVASGLHLDVFSVLPLAVRAALYDLAYDSAVQSFASTGSVVTNEVDNGLMAAAASYADRRSAELADPGASTGVVASTQNMVAAAISSGIAAGLSAADIADRIQESYTFGYERADAIGDFEAAKANGAGVLAGYSAAEALGVNLKKGWATAGDDKVEDICLANEAAGLIGINDTFPSGDDASPAHNHCRCDTYAVLGSAS